MKNTLLTIFLGLTAAISTFAQTPACPDGAEYRDGQCIHSGSKFWIDDYGWVWGLLILGVVGGIAYTVIRNRRKHIGN
jgi:hypothetical protein